VIDELRTERLLLRRWRPQDREPFAALNADPAVMAHFPVTLSRAQSDALADRIEAGFIKHGFGLWAVEAAFGPLALPEVLPPARGRPVAHARALPRRGGHLAGEVSRVSRRR
jgi:RimJ/RimL family protein N-acetyltransferase